MTKAITFGELELGDLFVLRQEPCSGCFSQVMEKIGQEFGQFFNVIQTMFSGVITTPKDAKVIKVYEKPFREVAIGHMFIPFNEGMPVIVGVSTLHRKTSQSMAAPLDKFDEPLVAKIFHGHEKVIDFGDVYKVKVVVKVELDLAREYGSEI